MNTGYMFGTALSQKLQEQWAHNHPLIRVIKLKGLFRCLIGVKQCHCTVLTRYQLAQNADWHFRSMGMNCLFGKMSLKWQDNSQKDFNLHLPNKQHYLMLASRNVRSISKIPHSWQFTNISPCWCFLLRLLSAPARFLRSLWKMRPWPCFLIYFFVCPLSPRSFAQEIYHSSVASTRKCRKRTALWRN